MTKTEQAENKSPSLPDPKALSPEYHKAHKQLMLWSAILFVWELVGIDLSKAKDAGGNVGPIVTALKSPQAVPWALMALVVYFLFKCSVEWAQCHVHRRKVFYARVDFISALVVSGAAIALYVGQAISRVQFANVVENPNNGFSILFGILLGTALLMIALAASFFRLHLHRLQFAIYALFAVSALAAAVLMWWRGGIVWWLAGIPVVPFTLAGVWFWFFVGKSFEYLAS